MKKILSLTLTALMVVSIVPTAFAADADYQNGTDVEYTGSRTTVNADGTATHNAEYTITVPALLAPGGSGTVTLEGYWPSDATVKVTAEEKVDMLNNITNGDKKELAVTFASIEKAGSNTAIVTASAPVSVADIANTLFGTWAGKFNYNVEYNGEAGGSGTVTPTPDPNPDNGDDDPVVLNGSATFSDGTTLSWDELMLKENGTAYGYDASLITNNSIGSGAVDGGAFNGCTTLTSIVLPDSVTSIPREAFKKCTNLTNIVIPEGVKSIGYQAFCECEGLTSVNIPVSITTIYTYGLNRCYNLTTINYAGTTAQWAAITLQNAWNDYVPATEVICSNGTIALS